MFLWWVIVTACHLQLHLHICYKLKLQLINEWLNILLLEAICSVIQLLLNTVNNNNNNNIIIIIIILLVEITLEMILGILFHIIVKSKKFSTPHHKAFLQSNGSIGCKNSPPWTNTYSAEVTVPHFQALCKISQISLIKWASPIWLHPNSAQKKASDISSSLIRCSF